MSSCEKCGGAGWVWGYELDNPSPETAADSMTRYGCDGCRSLREALAHAEMATTLCWWLRWVLDEDERRALVGALEMSVAMLKTEREMQRRGR